MMERVMLGMALLTLSWPTTTATTTTTLSDECEVTFTAYHSAPLEAKWIEHVSEWQDDVCGHTADTDIEQWLNAVEEFHKPTSLTHIVTVTPTLPSGAFNDTLSVFTHKQTCTDPTGHSVVKYIHTPIEPTASIVRDPRKCWEQMTEKYTQSKAYLVPMSGQGRQLLNGGHSHTQSHTQSRSFLFDAGATVVFAKESNNTADTRVDNNHWSGTNWIYDWYKKMGIVFDEVYAWEPSKKNRGKASRSSSKANQYRRNGKNSKTHRQEHRVLASENLEAFYPEGVMHFFDVGVTDTVGAQHNPLHLISQLCKPEDFVVFKLDIDSKFEINLVRQLLESPKLMNLIDEFYYEHHVRNHVMRMHGLGKNSDDKYSLAAWYDMATAARSKGFRMHFWP